MVGIVRSTTANLVWISWREVEIACERLFEGLPRKFDSMFVLSRGGLVPAAILSYKLHINKIDILPLGHTIRLSAFNGLIVDDIADTGRTFAALRPIFPNAYCAALFAKPLGASFCHGFGISHPSQEDWLVMPWAPSDEINR
jgi:hypoxanthine phosphoribosyltransferase